MKKYFYLLILFNINSFAQMQTEFYLDDVKNDIEYLTLNFCVDNSGKTSLVKVLPEKSIYQNKEIISQIIEYRKNIEYYSETDLKNNCYDQIFTFINTNLKDAHINETEFDELKKFRTGNFQYGDLNYKDVNIYRTENFQIEEFQGEVSKYNIEWVKPNSYILTYLEVSKEEYKYLLGEKINVEIIKLIDANTYVYKSNLLNRTFIIGIMKKI
ncbi:hypothetical protein [Empedobacter sp. UBA7248]|uniref:hypothetical protein n=1 Tax=Empedobacter sp. UBA7248 TaxID=1946448 RepID=UPI0025B9608A|nr:hypothetical protein [Empedobacter sp. UBA7248]